MPPHLPRYCGRIFFARAVISAASLTPVWSFHNHAIAAGWFVKFFPERERLALGVHRQGSAARRVHADADDLFRAKSFHGFFWPRPAPAGWWFPHHQHNPPDADEPGSDRATKSRLPRRVRRVQTAATTSRPLADVDNKRANRVGAVVQADGVLAAHSI